MSVAVSSLADVAAKQAITDVLHRYCRALDRMDRTLALSCWHEGGTDEHTPLFSGLATDFVDWVFALHAPMQLTRHVLSNILIEVEGEEAWSESYWTVLLRIERGGQLVDIWGGGRYIDHHRCVDGKWAFVHRRSVHDWDRAMPLDMTMADFPITAGAIHAPIYPAARSLSDPSYAALGAHNLAFK
jgi:hypothetical protein